uniref:Uncharacterized protein n=1 Tax=Marseillevirus LCMAC202 TaxID=2506606 RepID=A0A481YXM6_9VIRU|nr:MAG: hypothetical protein LCMAC202_02200 [Marseillevirus LCMAC202]
MFTAIRPKQENQLKEQPDCPICGSRYINEHTVVPSIYINLVVDIYECANQHSWEKYPGTIPPVPREPKATVNEEPFQNVYRPFQDTQELQKLR